MCNKGNKIRKKLMRIRRRGLALLLVLALCSGVETPVLAANSSQSAQKTNGVNSKKNKKKEKKELTWEEIQERELKRVYKMKIQSNKIKGWPKGPRTYGESGIVMDAGTGAILYAKNIDRHEYPASITKVLTALLALENGKLSDEVYFSNDCVSFIQPGDSTIGLRKGDKITLEQTLYATLLASANEAAYAVGENVGKNAGHDYNWFIDQMNEKCKELGGNNSHFANTNGLHDPNHYTCARDMALIGRELFKYPEFFKIVQTLNYKIPKSKTVQKHEFYQKHRMLWPGSADYYKYAVGGKTGYTSDALATLITMAKKGDTKLVCVVMRTHGRNIFHDTRNLFNYAYKNFKRTPVAGNETSKDIGEIIEDENSGYVMLPKGVKFSDLKMKMEVDRSKPSEATLNYTYRGHLVGNAKAKLSQSYLDAHKAKVESSVSDKRSDSKSAKVMKSIKALKNLNFKNINANTLKENFKKCDGTTKKIVAGLGALLIILILLFIGRLIKMRHFRRKQKKAKKKKK